MTSDAAALPSPGGPRRRIAVVGATGMVGRSVVREAIGRGHAVTGLSRRFGSERADLPGIAVDVFDRSALTAALPGHDVVVCCFNVAHVPVPGRNLYRATLEGSLAVVRACRAADVRLLFVGGAGSLHLKPGVLFYEAPGYPQSTMAAMPPAFLRWLATLPAPSYDASAAPPPYPEETGGPDYVPAFARVFDILEHDRTFDWSFFSPPPGMVPGGRTGRYVSAGPEVPFNGPHYGTITVDDAAVALLDEVEQDAHRHKHWTAHTPAG